MKTIQVLGNLKMLMERINKCGMRRALDTWKSGINRKVIMQSCIEIENI